MTRRQFPTYHCVCLRGEPRTAFGLTRSGSTFCAPPAHRLAKVLIRRSPTAGLPLAPLLGVSRPGRLDRKGGPHATDRPDCPGHGIGRLCYCLTFTARAGPRLAKPEWRGSDLRWASVPPSHPAEPSVKRE